MNQSAISASARLLLWCAGGTALVQLILTNAGAGNPNRFSPIFRYLLDAYDTHGNLLLLAMALCAFALRRRPEALAVVRFCGARPWTAAVFMFPLLCLGSLYVYHDYPLSMDEYAAVFQAKVFAAGAIQGQFPPDLIDWLIPSYFQGVFLNVSRSTGAVSTTYWPGFALLLAPFTWLGIPWVANPAIGALALPAIHHLTLQVGGSREAAGWAVALTAASSAFVVTSISYYSMPAHLLCSLVYASLLLQPSALRALLAGLTGSLALMLHQPVPHLLFCLPFFAWLLFRPKSAPVLAALAIGYLPLALVLGVGWHSHLMGLSGIDAAALPPASPAMVQSLFGRLGAVLALPSAGSIEARIAGLSKIWTWGATGLVVLAAYGYAAARHLTSVRLLGAAFAVTVLGYFLFPQDQGHGWGYRYIYSAWFVLPVLAAMALTGPQGERNGELRIMVGWGIVFSLVLVNGLRLVQVDTFMHRHKNQIPPVSRPTDSRPELLFIDTANGFYTRDMIQNDPFLRGPRIILVHRGSYAVAGLIANRFPGYVKADVGKWGELWRWNP